MADTYLTQEAHDRLKAELEELKTTGRERMSKEIEIARAHGDLKENAEYHAAKDEQGQMEARIRQLEALLRDAIIGGPSTTDEVRPGLVVTLDFDGDEEVYFVGSREEVKDGVEVLSADSPIGTAVIGGRVGETVKVEAPNGSYEVKILEISAP